MENNTTTFTGNDSTVVKDDILQNTGNDMDLTPSALAHGEHDYQDLVRRIIDQGNRRGDRTGTGTRTLFGQQLRFELNRGLPLFTTKYTNFKPILKELLWFLSGSTNNNDLDAQIWKEWAAENGDLGPIYGEQWRAWSAVDREGIRGDLEAMLATFNQWLGRYAVDGRVEIPRRNYDDMVAFVEGILPQLDKTVDQIQQLIQGLKDTPMSRRHILSGWNPSVLPSEGGWQYIYRRDQDTTEYDRGQWLTDGERLAHMNQGQYVAAEDSKKGERWSLDLDQLEVPNYRYWIKLSPQDNVTAGKAALPPCHTLFQCFCTEIPIQERLADAKLMGFLIGEDPQGGWTNATLVLDTLKVPKYRLSGQLYQRSADMLLGVPFNVASYALFLHMLASVCDMKVDELIWTGGDCHVYENHIEGAKELLEREPLPLPDLKLKSRDNIDDFVFEDFEVVDYRHHPKIKFEIAV